MKRIVRVCGFVVLAIAMTVSTTFAFTSCGCQHQIVTDTAVPATCTENGLTMGEHCSVCGETLIAQEIVPATGHIFVVDELIPATCTTNGLTEGCYCAVCGEIVVEQEVIPASHTLVIDEAVSPTCTVDGRTAGSHCSVCGEVITPQEIIKASHNIVTDEAVVATCTKSGLTEGSHCSVCGQIFVAQTVTKKAPHTFGDWDTVLKPSCLTEGKKVRTCAACGERETASLAKTNHVFGPYVYNNDATCTKNGTETAVCNICGKKLTVEAKNTMTKHSESSWITDKTATCEAVGLRHKICTVCSKVLVQESVGKTNHNYVNGTCTVCGHKQNEKTLAIGKDPYHIFTEDQIKEYRPNARCYVEGESYVESNVSFLGMIGRVKYKINEQGKVTNWHFSASIYGELVLPFTFIKRVDDLSADQVKAIMDETNKKVADYFGCTPPEFKIFEKREGCPENIYEAVANAYATVQYDYWVEGINLPFTMRIYSANGGFLTAELYFRTDESYWFFYE